MYPVLVFLRKGDTNIAGIAAEAGK